MKIVVIGGSGLIGTKVVKTLTEQGHEALAASPRTGVDATTGRGLAEALARAEVVVDVSNAPSFEDAAVLAFFEHAGRHLAHAEREAGVRHHVALSVVGTDRLPDNGYFRAKLAQERLINTSGIPSIRSSGPRSSSNFSARSPLRAPTTTVFACRMPASSPSRPTMWPRLWRRLRWARLSTRRLRSRVPNGCR
jgi:NAD(P)-dependent dehydrogenase (short-subunit alcohol dehydrogenase family)